MWVHLVPSNFGGSVELGGALYGGVSRLGGLDSVAVVMHNAGHGISTGARVSGRGARESSSSGSSSKITSRDSGHDNGERVKERY